MGNKFNARGSYVCIDCHTEHVKVDKRRPKCEPGHRVVYFDSQKEYRRYRDLWLRQKAGEIRWLLVKPRFALNVNNKKIGSYSPDFSYVMGSQQILEDVKGFMNSPQREAFELRRKLTEAIYGVRVEVV